MGLVLTCTTIGPSHVIIYHNSSYQCSSLAGFFFYRLSILTRTFCPAHVTYQSCPFDTGALILVLRQRNVHDTRLHGRQLRRRVFRFKRLRDLHVTCTYAHYIQFLCNSVMYLPIRQCFNLRTTDIMHVPVDAREGCRKTRSIRIGA